MEAMLQEIVPLTGAHALHPAGVVAETNVAFAGIGSEKVTLLEAAGPRFCATIV